MATSQQLIAQELANSWALAAQKYAGYFYGHPTRAGQYGTSDSGKVFVDYDKPWEEPLVFEDGCEFCEVMTDERVEERILGFQRAIDKEVIGQKYQHFNVWIASGDPRVPEPFHAWDSPANMRAFCELFEDDPTEKRPAGWLHRALNLTLLPPHLKRRLCIEWNHLLRDWLIANPVFEYDMERREIVTKPTLRDEDTLAADPEENQALLELRDEDRTFASAGAVDDGLNLEQQYAQEYADGLF